MSLTEESILLTSFCAQQPTVCFFQDLMLLLAAPGVSLFLYGIYIVLLAMCTSIVLKNWQRRSNIRCLLMAMFFILASTSILVNTANVLLSTYAARLIVNFPYISKQTNTTLPVPIMGFGSEENGYSDIGYKNNGIANFDPFGRDDLSPL
ncbi:hypothetical protein AAF712_012626 [Marasmius tenuissimus]|uniref:Uncharacterized protein n=1 Tax=Marasmius tenuissimus TaxID=585030 RepID=A0ABR2ZGY0_9AGAR|nr:hypothetical protein PM082_018589 [Marasmius tenuissimus]